MKNDEKKMLRDYEEDAIRFKNFCILLFVIGTVIGTTLAIIYFNL